MYKNFVLIISDDVVDPGKMFDLEKQINDIMEQITFYLN